MKAHTYKNTLLQVAQGNALTKTCKRVFLFPTQEKLKIKKNPSLQKNKTSQTHNQKQSSIWTVHNLTTKNSATTEKRRAACNSTFAIGGVTCFYDTFVVKESAVLRMNICAEKPAHRKSAKR